MTRKHTIGDDVQPNSGMALRAAERVLLPLVRLLLDNGIGLPTAVEQLKAAYVKVADREFRISGRLQSDSRVSILTGVHRKDVRRLRREPVADDAPPRSVSLGGQIIVRWTGRQEYLDSRGRPRALPRLRRDGGARSFEALAESVSKDVGPRAMLDELLRLGIVEINRRDCVRLNKAAFVPREGYEEKAFYLAKNVHDHLAAAVDNLRGDTPPHLERSVHYAELSEHSVAQLRRLAERVGMHGLNRINRVAQALKQADTKHQRGGHGMTFGTYFFSAGEDRPDHDTGEKDPTGNK
jgi:hypothetical protein